MALLGPSFLLDYQSSLRCKEFKIESIMFQTLLDHSSYPPLPVKGLERPLIIQEMMTFIKDILSEKMFRSEFFIIDQRLGRSFLFLIKSSFCLDNL